VLLAQFLVLPQIATLLTQTNRAFRAQDIASRDLSLKDSLGSASHTTRHQKFATPHSNNHFCIVLVFISSFLSPFHRAIRCLSPETPPSLHSRRGHTQPYQTATMSNRKRSRSVGEENRAECPFTITYANNPSRAEQERHKNKKRKRDGQDDDKRVQIQISPFSPTGSFKTHDTMDLYYTVEPGKRWQDMTRYNSFVRKYLSDGIPASRYLRGLWLTSAS
jgi:hypothetical protein